MAGGAGGGRKAREDKQRRLTQTFDYVISNPPYMKGMDPLAITRMVLDRLPQLKDMSKPQAKRLRTDFDAFVESLADYRERIDPVRDPSASFDPSNPDTIGRLVVIALLAQDRVPLKEIRPTYGSGVYAIYYIGQHPAYSEISGTETPIYVGKADPADAAAATPRQQGARLFVRLTDHRNAIHEVETYATVHGLPDPLRVVDFECRRLVCATNAQLVAERHLIGYFHPAWNQESKICFGISKHGDAATTRANKKAPWDVLHPGRDWALASPVKAGMNPQTVTDALTAHFGKYPPVRDQEAFMEVLLDAFKQVGRASAEVSEMAAETEEVTEAITHLEPEEPEEAQDDGEDFI